MSAVMFNELAIRRGSGLEVMYSLLKRGITD